MREETFLTAKVAVQQAIRLRGGWGKVPVDCFYSDPGFKYIDKVFVGAD